LFAKQGLTYPIVWQEKRKPKCTPPKAREQVKGKVNFQGKLLNQRELAQPKQANERPGLLCIKSTREMMVRGPNLTSNS